MNRWLGIAFCLFASAFLLNAQQVTLLFAGDAMQHQSQLDNAFRNGEYDYSSCFQHLQPEISRADLAVINMEGVLGGPPFRGYPMFSFPDAFAIALKEAGFNLFLTANNHAVDRYSKGINRTIDVLDSLGVYHTGTFKNTFEREENYPLFIEKKGIRMAFLNYTYDTNGLNPAAPCVVNYIDTAVIRQDIEKARRKNPDVLIAMMHWGKEYRQTPDKSQKRLARFLMNEGVDLIIGSHPHVIQPSLIFTDSIGENKHLVVYSLGNFISGMKAVNTDGGQLVSVTLKKTAGKTQIESCGTTLFYTYQKEENKKIDFTLVPVSLAEKSQMTLSNCSQMASTNCIELDAPSHGKMMRFANNARDLFRQYNQGVNEYRITTEKPKEDFFSKYIPIKFAF